MNITLQNQRQTLEELWAQGRSDQKLLHQYTLLVDEFIQQGFARLQASKKLSGKVAVVALGGYGRQDLYPFSDIDLLLLHDRKATSAMQEISEALLYPLWDAGFEVGHSVRTIKDCISFAKEDFIFKVSLLDARLLAGDTDLFLDMQKRYRKKTIEGHRHGFVTTMDDLRTQRRKKYGTHSYLLEPHIKEGKGGMRDMQSMLWVAKAVFGLDDLAAIERSGILTHQDCQALQESLNMLTRIRNRLHYIRRRKNDQLIFEFQEEMAEAFAYDDHGGQRAVEYFMRDVYSHLQTIAQHTDLFFEHVFEVLGLDVQGEEEQELERCIIARNGSVRLLNRTALVEQPRLLMRLFLQAGRTGLFLHHRTRRIITENLDIIDDNFRRSKRVSKTFFSVLMESTGVFSVLESMLATGVLSRYIPEFASIESLAQHDLYHLYTVDRHLLQAVAELHVLKEDPDMERVFAAVQKPELLYLAALLHDIGKGKQADHSQLGADMMQVIGKRLQFDPQDIETVSFLITYHLYMPENALRRDLSDQQVIRQAVELVGTTDRLAMLYLLSIADSKATGPSAWSNWKASLLREMYTKVYSYIEAEETAGTDGEQGLAGELILRRKQVQEACPPELAEKIAIDQLGDDYVMNFAPDVVVHHLTLYGEHTSRLQQQVLTFPTEGENLWGLLVMSRDRSGLLAKVCGVLALHNLSVRSAQIFTWPDGTAVDALEVSSDVGNSFAEQNWQGLQTDINSAINYRLDVGYRLHRKAPPVCLGRNRQVQQLDCDVLIDNTTSEQYTIIEVYGDDHNIILYQLTQTLADFGLGIHRARIATEVEQLINVFYVSTRTGEKLLDPELTEKVRTTLLGILGCPVVEELTE